MDNQPKDFLGKDKDLIDRIYALKKMRENFEPLSYLSRRAYEGKHFMFWDKSEKKLAEYPTKKAVFNQLPEVAKQTDAFENFLLSTNFVFTLVPAMLSDDDAIKSSQRLSLLAKTYHDRLKDSTTYADLIHYSLMDNVSFIEITPNDQQTDVQYRMYEFFDVLFNPTIRNWDEQRLVVKLVKRRISDLKNSDLYNVPDGYTGAGMGNFNSWKDIYEIEKYSQFVTMEKDETLLFECFMLEYDPDTKKDVLRIKTIDASYNVLRNDVYKNIHGITIRPLRTFSGEWYQPSYVYRLIPMNRSLDTIASRFEDLVLRLAKGGWIVQEEEDIDGGMNEETGQIVRYATVKPEQMQMPTIPNFLMDWFGAMLNMSERYGLSSVISGGMPAKSSGIRAGKMIDQMTGLALKNNTAPINNLRSVIKDVLKYTLLFLYEMWDTPQDVIYTDLTANMPAFISQKARNLYKGKDQGGTQDLVAIPSEFKRFDVEVDDGMGYTLEERKNTAILLRKLNVIGDETLKKMFKLGSSGYILEAETGQMMQSPEFKALMTMFQNGQMSDEQKQAFIIMVKTLGGQLPAGGAPTTPGAPTGAMPPTNPPTTGQPVPPTVGTTGLAPTQAQILPVQPQSN